MTLISLIESIWAYTKYCPQEKWGFACNRTSKAYNYHCPDCGRYGELHDPEIVEKK